VESVRARGGVVDFLVFEDEGHGLIKIPNRIRGYTAAVDFLDKHMGG
jgi:dipeptidyl aminopeptidase/acylaminoacyl peptidase